MRSSPFLLQSHVSVCISSSLPTTFRNCEESDLTQCSSCHIGLWGGTRALNQKKISMTHSREISQLFTAEKSVWAFHVPEFPSPANPSRVVYTELGRWSNWLTAEEPLNFREPDVFLVTMCCKPAWSLLCRRHHLWARSSVQQSLKWLSGTNANPCPYSLDMEQDRTSWRPGSQQPRDAFCQEWQPCTHWHLVLIHGCLHPLSRFYYSFNRVYI